MLDDHSGLMSVDSNTDGNAFLKAYVTRDIFAHNIAIFDDFEP